MSRVSNRFTARLNKEQTAIVCGCCRSRLAIFTYVSNGLTLTTDPGWSQVRPRVWALTEHARVRLEEARRLAIGHPGMPPHLVRAAQRKLRDGKATRMRTTIGGIGADATFEFAGATDEQLARFRETYERIAREQRSRDDPTEDHAYGTATFTAGPVTLVRQQTPGWFATEIITVDDEPLTFVCPRGGHENSVTAAGIAAQRAM
jgi:hypothetical protein